jgi:hypothetical protein
VLVAPQLIAVAGLALKHANEMGRLASGLRQPVWCGCLAVSFPLTRLSVNSLQSQLLATAAIVWIKATGR